MLTFQQARQIAEDNAKAISVINQTDELIIIDRATIEKPYAWIFFYDSKRNIEPEHTMYILGGNTPFFISKIDGQMSTFRTGLNIEEMIEEYEERHQIRKLVLVDNIYNDATKLLDLKRIFDLSNYDIANYKNVNKMILTSGSEIRLSNLRKKLNEKISRRNCFNKIQLDNNCVQLKCLTILFNE